MKLFFFCALLFLQTAALLAQETLPLYDRTNSVKMDETLQPLRQAVQPTLLRILNEDSKTILTGTFITEDGYFVTKASEAPQGERLSIQLADDTQRVARVVQRLQEHDLLLAKADVSHAQAVRWQALEKQRHGQWLAAPSSGLDENLHWQPIMRIGVMSAQNRSIAASRPALGLELRNAPQGGVRIASVWPESPAAKAGLTEADHILRVEEQPIKNALHMTQLLADKWAGQVVKLQLRRSKQNIYVNVRLGSMSRVSLTATGEDYVSGGVSLRTDGFKTILQHDLPLKSRDMGGPLLNLAGECIGINIARVDRISTYALPAAELLQPLQQSLKQDRQMHREVIRKATAVAALH
jgi:S1-C subfamily serine protease